MKEKKAILKYVIFEGKKIIIKNIFKTENIFSVALLLLDNMLKKG